MKKFYFVVFAVFLLGTSARSMADTPFLFLRNKLKETRALLSVSKALHAARKGPRRLDRSLRAANGE